MGCRVVAAAPELLTPRWYPLRPHAGQYRYWISTARFDLLECTRRGGKTELFKRKGVTEACFEHHRKQIDDASYIYACPTRDQVKDIYWDDLKKLSPDKYVRKISESELWIDFINGARIQLSGMDKPARAEGKRPARFFCDEFHAWKPGIYKTNIRPALSTIGVNARCAIAGITRESPDFKELSNLAKSGAPGWAYHSWDWRGLLDEADIADAKRTLDQRTFDTEYGAKRVDRQGRVYYAFEREVHGRERLRHLYNRGAPLRVDLDFNVEPGVAGISQRVQFREDSSQRLDRPEVADVIDAYIGIVHIPFDSNTHRVCRKIIEDWGTHEGPLFVYGDPAGGQRKTSAEEGQTDWTIVRDVLGQHFGHERVSIFVKSKAPAVRSRVNAMNARLRTTDGLVHTLIDPDYCGELLDDFEQTTTLPGSAGEIDKKRDPRRTHLTDGASYRADYEFGVDTPILLSEELR
jgi:hypothetical protein